MLVNPLAANLDLDGLQQDVTHPVQPAEGAAGNGDSGQLNAQEHAVDQITIAGDGRGDFATESSAT